MPELSYLTIPCKDIALVAKLYGQLFKTSPVAKKEGFMIVETSTIKIAFLTYEKWNAFTLQQKIPQEKNNILISINYSSVDELNTIITDLQKDTISTQVPLTTVEWGAYSIIKDPEDNLIELAVRSNLL